MSPNGQCPVEYSSPGRFVDGFDLLVVIILMAMFVSGIVLGYTLCYCLVVRKFEGTGHCPNIVNVHDAGDHGTILQTTLSNTRDKAHTIFERVTAEISEHMAECPYGKDIYIAGKNGQVWHKSRDCRHIAQIPDGCLKSYRACGTCACLKVKDTPLTKIDKKTSRTLMDDFNSFE